MNEYYTSIYEERSDTCMCTCMSSSLHPKILTVVSKKLLKYREHDEDMVILRVDMLRHQVALKKSFAKLGG